MSEKYLVTSHGFATDPDSGKLFSSSAEYLLNDRTMINFDHFKKYQDGNDGDIYIPSLDEQTEKLSRFISSLDGEVLLMAHSRGTTAACGAAILENVTNVVLMAPPHEAGSDTIVQMIRDRGGGRDENGDLILHRTNSTSKIYISSNYFPNMEAFEHMETYQRVADTKPTIFVTGARDTVVDENIIREIRGATHMSVDAGHNLYNREKDVREQLAIDLAVALGARAINHDE